MEGLRELALFAGAGGGILGGKLLGWRTVCAVEIDSYCRKVLLARQRDGILEPFPIWDDVKTFDGTQWRGSVDVVSGGFPCQDISCAGKGKGLQGERSGLWTEMARIVGEVQPKYVFVENSPMLTSRGLGRVLGDLATLGFDARWGVLGAIDVGAPHRRKRIWIVGFSNNHGFATSKILNCIREGIHTSTSRSYEAKQFEGSGMQHKIVANTYSKFSTSEKSRSEWSQWNVSTRCCGSWWETEPCLGRVADGVAHRVDRLKSLGNGQVPAVVRLAWRTLTEGLA